MIKTNTKMINLKKKTVKMDPYNKGLYQFVNISFQSKLLV